MDYRELLRNASEEYLRMLASEHGIRRDLRGSELSTAILNRLTDQRYLKQLSAKLDPPYKTILRALMIASTHMGVPANLARRKLDELGKELGRDAGMLMSMLARRGFIATLSTPENWVYYLVPTEIQQCFSPMFQEEVRDMMDLRLESPVSCREDGQAFLYDLYAFLMLVRFESPKITQARRLHKRVEKSLLKSFDIAEDSQLPLSDEKNRIGWIQDFAFSEGLIKEADQNLVLSSSVKEWIQLSPREHLLALYTYWQDLHTYLYQHLATQLLKMLQPDEWITMNSFHETMRRFSLEALWDTLLQVGLFERFFRPLIYFGFIRYASEPPCFSLTPPGYQLLHGLPTEQKTEGHYTIVVQPDYEILAERRLAPQIRWRLDTLATLDKSDHMMIFRLSQESVYRALKEGMTSEDIIDFLKQYSRTPIPQNVEYTINEWASRYGQLELVDALLLRCRDAQLAEELKATPKLIPYIRGEVSPTHLIIRRAGQHHFVRELEKLGHMPKPEVLFVSGCDDDAG